MTQAVVYARFSPRPNAAECDSNRKQFERCRAYCKAHGYQIVAVRWDRDLSGGRADNRPGLQRAMRDACKPGRILVVYSLDRFARNTRDALALLDKLHAADADLAMLLEGINTRTPMGECMFTVVAAFKQLERRQIQERTSRAMRHYQAHGRRMTRRDRCPFGKMPDPENPAALVESAEETEVIRLIGDLRATGMGAKAITTELNRRNVPSRGNRWHVATVQRILKRAVVKQVT